MKTKHFILALILAIGTAGVLVACKGESAPEGSQQQEADISHYTCPMHHQIHRDHPGDCPICGMKLVPVYKESSSDRPDASDRSDGILLSPKRQELIGVKTVLVSRKEISRTIHASGKIIPLENKSVVQAALYSDEISGVKPGMEAFLSTVSGEQFKGVVKGVNAAIDPITRLGTVAIEVPQGKIPPSDFFNITIQVPLGEFLSIPKSAIIDTGTRKTAFVVNDQNRFQARDIQTDIQTDEDVVVTGGVKEGEKVVIQAAFLIDSESQLKAAVSGMEEHQH